jgi:hypothetical protein
MPRKLLSKIPYCILALFLVPLTGNAKNQVIGNAYDGESGQYLYSEYHSCTSSKLECLVDYRDPSGQLIVSKKLNYTAGFTQPTLIMKDYRTGKDTIINSEYREGLVVDAGFDNFVRSQWDTLTTGDTVKFLFLVAGFDEPLKMRASLDRSRSCNAEQLCLEIVLDSWLLRFLADPIALAYSLDSKRLLRYQGLSNIRDENNKSMIVDIHYDYERLFPMAENVSQQESPRYSF